MDGHRHLDNGGRLDDSRRRHRREPVAATNELLDNRGANPNFYRIEAEPVP